MHEPASVNVQACGKRTTNQWNNCFYWYNQLLLSNHLKRKIMQDDNWQGIIIGFLKAGSRPYLTVIQTGRKSFECSKMQQNNNNNYTQDSSTWLVRNCNSLYLYNIRDAYALQASPIHNSHYRIIFFQGSFFYVYIESPNSKKPQKTPHHSLETPSTENTNPKNQIQDPNTPTPEPP